MSNKEFEKNKIMKISTNKAVVDVLVDSFAINKVKMTFATYETGNQKKVDIYVDFPTFMRIAHDIKTGKLFQQLNQDRKPITLAQGGTSSAKSKRADGKPEARILSMAIGSSQTSPIFLNAVSGAGKEIGTGIIALEKEEKKVSVNMSYDDCKELFIYTEACVQAYLSSQIPEQVKQAQANFENFKNSSH